MSFIEAVAGLVEGLILSSHARSQAAPVLDFQTIHCPYCGEPFEIAVDGSAGDQQYVEDCQVCCRPINMILTVDGDGDARVVARAEDEA